MQFNYKCALSDVVDDDVAALPTMLNNSAEALVISVHSFGTGALAAETRNHTSQVFAVSMVR